MLELGDVLGDGEVYFGLGKGGEKEGGEYGDGEGEQSGSKAGIKVQEVNGVKVYDRLEEIAASVEAPEKSLRSVGGSGEVCPWFPSLFSPS